MKQHHTKYIIYRRISTLKQEASGLGLDAQMNEINVFLSAQNDYEIIDDLVETASGKDHLSRPKIIQAMKLASKTGATILDSPSKSNLMTGLECRTRLFTITLSSKVSRQALIFQIQI